MKKIYKNRRCIQYIMLLTAGMLMAGCSAEDEFSKNESTQQLDIVPMVNDIKATTRADEDNLHEKTLTTLDFKLGNNQIDQHYTDAQDRVKKVLGNWESLGLQVDKTYDYYAVANAKVDFKGKTPAEMLASTQEDADIWQTYTETNQKKFLMSCTDQYKLTTAQDQTIPVQLVRAAAKIQLNLTTSVPNYKATSVKWKLINYNTNTSVFDGHEAEAKIVGDDSNTPTNESQSVADQKFAITTYSYATKWENNSEAPQVVLAITFTSDTDNSIVEKLYAIPVRDVTQSEKFIERNHIYTINAEIKNLNKSSEIHYGEADYMKYAITKWSEGGTTKVNAGKQSYLVVYPTLLILKNQSRDWESIKFFSSEDCQIKDVKAWYIDQNGNKKDTNLNGNVQITENFRNGVVKFDSSIPTNLTVKYVSFKVYCGSGDTYREQEVIVKQYPLEYIQNIEGWYSTKSLDGWIDWQRDQKAHDEQKTSSDKHFQAKVYNAGIWDSYIYDYNDKENKGGNKKPKSYKAEKSTIGHYDQSNNHMYVIQITSTNGDYKIGHVQNIDSNTKQSQENVVSPAFALASQLGTVGQFDNSVDAAKHCADYVEVAKDGTRYDDWRLPTEDEIKVIAKYQFQLGQDAISAVLQGRTYWALNGNKVIANSSDSYDNYVRCVRDLSTEEIEKLENEK